ncbi:MAG TPA: copper transporter [Streptosporangiaceae bacterium]|nr:copper transporter [Streptosporangiaceae bacterium]
MINFRYHVVSIVAVFLALAIGLVLGATELQGASINLLTKTSNSLHNDLDAARAQNGALSAQVAAQESFVQDDEARLLGGLLTGQRVVVVAAPGAPGAVVNGVTTAVQQAGASVTGQVNLQPKLLDASQSNQSFLSQLVTQLVEPDGTAPGGTPLQQAAQLLGGAILTKTDPSGTTGGGTSSGTGTGTTGDSTSTRQSVLSSYAQGGLLSVSGPLSSSQAPVAATLAIVVIPATLPPGGDNDPANLGLVTLAQEFDTAGLGTVMAGSITGSVGGSAINALRSSSASGQISTVDDADTVFGQITTVQALQQALTGHKSGSYGEDPGASAVAPDPAPTPASTPSTTAKTTGGKTQTHRHTGGSKSGGRA